MRNLGETFSVLRQPSQQPDQEAFEKNLFFLLHDLQVCLLKITNAISPAATASRIPAFCTTYCSHTASLTIKVGHSQPGPTSLHAREGHIIEVV